MKRLMRVFAGLFIVLIPIGVVMIFISRNQTTSPTKSSAEEVISAENQNNNSIKIGSLNFVWYQVDKIDKLRLIPNFSEKLSSTEVMNRNSCKFLSNAGFYSTDNKPLGLFIYNGKTFFDFQSNSLFDGILSVNDMATPRITTNIPEDHLDIALQTGPIIKENGQYQILRIKNDNEARRVIAGVTGENKLYFIGIYDTNSEYIGPNLADLPSDLQSFEEKSHINFADIINLDGGAASTFNTSSIRLSEINPVGAFFCQL